MSYLQVGLNSAKVTFNNVFIDIAQGHFEIGTKKTLEIHSPNNIGASCF